MDEKNYSQLPKYSVYSSNFQGKEVWGVKEGCLDKMFGDGIFKSEQEAEDYADFAQKRDIKKSENEINRLRLEKEKEEKERLYLESFKGFLGTDPMRAGRLRKILEKQGMFKGKIMTRKEFVEKTVKEGAEVRQGRLYTSENTFWDKADITKTCIDYAEHLINVNK